MSQLNYEIYSTQSFAEPYIPHSSLYVYPLLFFTISVGLAAFCNIIAVSTFYLHFLVLLSVSYDDHSA